MQLNTCAGTPQSMGVKVQDLKNPDWNIYAGAKYLAVQYAKYKDWSKSISAYNAGSYTSKNYSSYVKPVLAYWKAYEASFNESGIYSPVSTNSSVTKEKKTTQKTKLNDISKHDIGFSNQEINISDIMPYIGYALLAVVGIVLISQLKS
jgi:soluble lytic murein transglycosylase-like protein